MGTISKAEENTTFVLAYQQEMFFKALVKHCEMKSNHIRPVYKRNREQIDHKFILVFIHMINIEFNLTDNKR